MHDSLSSVSTCKSLMQSLCLRSMILKTCCSSVTNLSCCFSARASKEWLHGHPRASGISGLVGQPVPAGTPGWEISAEIFERRLTTEMSIVVLLSPA